MENNYGIKELYSVALKATYNMEIGGRVYEPGEVVLCFDSIQVASLSENKTYTNASGGFENKTLITWDNTKNVTFNCTQGVVSKNSLAILSDSQLAKTLDKAVISVPIIGEEQSPVNGVITLKHKPNGTGFIYNKNTREKLFSNISSQEFAYGEDIIADYNYDYTNGAQILTVGQRLLNGYMRLEGKMRLKDDYDGHEKTGIIIIPKIEIASSLSIRLGRNADPMVSSFSFIGYPVGNRGTQKVCDIQFLNDDIDSDF